MTIPAIDIHTDDKEFVRCLPPILVQEGGNDDDPHDPGGRTSRGVIQREYNAYRDLKGLPHKDVWTASWDEIFDIYYVNYWLPIAKQLWAGCNLMYFDQSVNQGPAQAARNVQRAINNFADPSLSGRFLRAVHLKKGMVAVDGVVGVITLAALDKLRDNRDFLRVYFEQDMSFYHSLRQWARYGRGWSNRANAIYRQAVAFLQTTGGTV